MKIQDIIQVLQGEGTWVSWEYKTRDQVLCGDITQDVNRVGVCWVATKQVIQHAIDHDIHFIITHENPFYQCSTNMMQAAKIAADEKKDMLEKHHITLYRCHDVWDSIRDVGVSDTWAKRLGFSFEPRLQASYYQCANIEEMSVEALAKHCANCLLQDGEQGVYVFGDVQKKIHRIAIGTGAATNLYDMLQFQPDAMIVSDDGINNYDAAQYAIDQHLPIIVVNHAGCEIGGLKAMAPWLQAKIGCHVEYIKEGYDIHYYIAD